MSRFKRIWNWTAKRSGTEITITGVDAEQKAIKITVPVINGGTNGALATCQAADGQYYDLA